MRSCRIIVLVTGAVFGPLVATNTAAAQQRPLLTEDVEVIRPGTIRLEVGFDFLQSQRFALSGLRGDLTRIGVWGLNLGLSPNVEVQLDGVIQDFLAIDGRSPSAVPLQLPRANSTNDLGDLVLSTKILVRREGKRSPALGMRFGLSLPNSNQARGIGTNQMSFFSGMLAGKQLGRLNLFGNLGLGIMPAPLKTFTQNDLLLYGLAGIFRVTPNLNLVGEINGRKNTRRLPAPVGTESQSQGRFGMQLKAAGLRWDLAGVKGIGRFSPQSGVTFGVTRDIPLFLPVK